MIRSTKHSLEIAFSGHIKSRMFWEQTKAWTLGRPDTWALLLLFLLSGFLHLWRLHVPAEPIFDEVYFPVFAQDYLNGTPFFDAHPPLAKYLIAVGIRVFGYTPFGYRIVAALFGVGLILLMYQLARVIFGSRQIALTAGLLATLDGLLLTESRAGLINVFAVFFSLAAYLFFLQGADEHLDKPRWRFLLAAGACAGAAAAVKWVGIASLGVIWLMVLGGLLYRHWPKCNRQSAFASRFSRIGQIPISQAMLFLGVVPVLVYSLSFIPHLLQNSEFGFWELHKQMFGYHAHLQEGHRYASPWWSWPLVYRPVAYYWKVNETIKQALAIVNIGNPILWWLTLPAIFVTLWKAIVSPRFEAWFVLVAYAAHYLPFSLISRATFSYHYMGALPFAIMMLAWMLNSWWKQGGWRRELAALCVLIILACGLYFLPLWIGYPLPIGAYYQRMWFVRWI